MGTLKLNHEGREYLHFPVSHLPANIAGGMEIRFPPATAWTPTEWVTVDGDVWSVWDGVSGLPSHIRVLVSGPDIDAGTGIGLVLGKNGPPETRLTSAPEVIIRTSPTSVTVIP
ncbi:MAG: hypothetical protein ACOH10_10360 [Rhodoglobus sp.]